MGRAEEQDHPEVGLYNLNSKMLKRKIPLVWISFCNKQRDQANVELMKKMRKQLLAVAVTNGGDGIRTITFILIHI